MSQEIVKKLSAPFRAEQVKTRLGSFNPNTGVNDSYNYVTADDVLNRLREVFGASFSTEYTFSNVMDNKDGRKKYVVVGVELSYYDETGRQYKALGMGGKDITADPGADYKAALSKAVKSAAKLWGVPVDGGLEDEEAEEGNVIVTPASPPRPGTPPRPGAPAPAATGAAAPKPGAPAPTAPKPGAPTPGATAAPTKQAAPAAGATTAITPPKPPAPKPAATAEAVAPTQARPKAPAPVPAAADLNVDLDDESEGELEIEEGELENDDGAACNDCGGEIVDDKDINNQVMTADYITQLTLENFGVPVCASCVRERKKAAAAE